MTEETRWGATLNLTLRQWLLMQRVVKYAGEIDADSADDLFGNSDVREKITESIAALRVNRRGHRIEDVFTGDRIARIVEVDSYSTMGVIERNPGVTIEGQHSYSLMWDTYPERTGEGRTTAIATSTYPTILMEVAKKLEPLDACAECGGSGIVDVKSKVPYHNRGCTYFEVVR